ncbi:MAG: hypothetical protein WC314_18885 [Vulcanimicrobiota bacterium]
MLKLQRSSKIVLSFVLFSLSLRIGLTEVARQTEVSFLDAAGFALNWLSGVWV